LYILFQPVQPTISMTPSSGKQYDPLEELDALETPRSNAKSATEMKKTEKTAEKKPANSGGSWFGGLFSKLAPKPKNQMILPDDSNPTVRIYCIIYILIQLIKELCDSSMFYVVKDSRGYFW